MSTLPSKRAFLASVINPATGQPYAKADTVGKFSNAALAFAEQNKDKWADAAPVVRTPAAPRPTVTRTPSAPATPAPLVDTKEVRAWAKQNGHVVGDKGRLPRPVIDAYIKAGGKATVPAARPTPLVMPRRRPETQAFGLYRRGPKDNPKIVSEPLLVISTCGKCGAGVSYCPCADGPRMPDYAGGEVAMLDPKPIV